VRNKENKKSRKVKEQFHGRSDWGRFVLVTLGHSESEFFELHGLKDKVSPGRLVQNSKCIVIYHNE